MGKTIVLVFQELKILSKDRQALGLLFIMPLALIVFLTLALQDVYLAKVGHKSKLLVVTGKNCEKKESVCSDILNEFKKFDYDFNIISELNTQATKNPNEQIAVFFPEDIEHTLTLLKKNEALSDKDRIQLVFDPTLDQSFRSLVQGNLLSSLQSVLIDQIRKELKKLDLPKSASPFSTNLVTDIVHFKDLIQEKAWGGVVLPNPIQQMVPAWTLFGMFFIVIPLSNSVIRDRRLGVFKRLLSFPVGRRHLIAGKILPFFIINVIQFFLMFLVGVFILPRLTHLKLTLDFSLWGITAITFVCAMTSTSYGFMISSLSKTSEQASSFGSLSVVILAILGGVMIPRFVMPDFMQTMSEVSPLYWGLEAYQDLIVRKLSLEHSMPKLGILLCFSMVFLFISRLKFRWSEVS